MCKFVCLLLCESLFPPSPLVSRACLIAIKGKVPLLWKGSSKTLLHSVSLRIIWKFSFEGTDSPPVLFSRRVDQILIYLFNIFRHHRHRQLFLVVYHTIRRVTLKSKKYVLINKVNALILIKSGKAHLLRCLQISCRASECSLPPASRLA